MNLKRGLTPHLWEGAPIRFCGISIYNLIVLVVFIALLGGILGAVYGPGILKLAKEPDVFLEFIAGLGPWGALVFVGIQVLQIIVPPIPGELVQIAAGYIFGPLLGTVYLLLGALLAQQWPFILPVFLGYPFIRALVSTAKLERLRDLMRGPPRLDLAVFIVFLIPGFPKDLLTYLAGLTELAPGRFLLLSLAGRFPALFVSVIMGSNLRDGAYVPAVILAVLAVGLALVSWRYGKSILNRLKGGGRMW